jgi:hypothetical protein
MELLSAFARSRSLRSASSFSWERLFAISSSVTMPDSQSPTRLLMPMRREKSLKLSEPNRARIMFGMPIR